MTNKFQCLTCGGTYFDRCNDGLIYLHVCGAKSQGPALSWIPYDNPRNENTATTKLGAITGIVSEGAGVKCLSDQRLTEPPWITLVKSRVASDAEE
jgi:hypothetical protein